MSSPYENLPPEAYWKTGVAAQTVESLSNLYQKKFPIRRETAIATAGSCFAQHITKHLRARGFCVLDAEPAPPGLDLETSQRFGYGLYSARYGNIYTARQLRQLAEEALDIAHPSDIVWKKEGRFYDALRPSVEPLGLSTAAAVLAHRRHHIGRVRHVISSAEIFVFTLGLTEAWVHRKSGVVFPTAPGTIAGEFDPQLFEFRNFTFQEIYDDLMRFIELLRNANPDVRFLLTVSPVPLTATASGEHVLRATTYSKSVLRAVAGQLFQERDDVDYVPSYDLITSSLSCGRYFEANLRSVRPEGVDAVMRIFFSEHDATAYDAYARPAEDPGERIIDPSEGDDEVVCEEAMLEAFAP